MTETRRSRETHVRRPSADRSFFDSLDRNELKKMLEIRVADGWLLRLIGKCLHVGVLDGMELSASESGTVQGSVLSPLLGKRLGRFGPTLHPDKTRLLPFRCPPVGRKGGKGPATIDFLGFTSGCTHAPRGRATRRGLVENAR